MKKIGFKQKMRYYFDNTMSKGITGLIGWLGIITILIVAIAALVMIVLKIMPDGEDQMSFIEGFWRGLMRTLDAGTMGGDVGWGFRIVMFFVTVGGIMIVSALIGIISNSISDKIEELRKGRSFVIEKNHTLILGWSSKIFTIISELAEANANQKKPRIVILADKDKVEMEDEISERVGKTKNTKVICRCGNPNDLSDLHIANPYDAKSIIVLNKDHENADSQVIKTILALTNSPKRPEKKYHIVAEIHENRNIEIAKMVGKDELITILPYDIISRIMVQTSRQAGLSVVYNEIMAFEGDELYFSDEKKLVGKTFGDALPAYDDSSAIGLRKKNGEVLINPPMDTIINPGDEIIALSEDDDTVVVKGKPTAINEDAIVKDEIFIERKPEVSLLLGWNKRAPIIIRELDSYVLPGSKLVVAGHLVDPTDEIEKLKLQLSNISLSFINKDLSDQSSIRQLEIERFHHIMLLSYEDIYDIQEADAQTLITLLHLRQITEEKNLKNDIVSQMLDTRNRDLAVVTKADDFIVSDKLISLLLSQISENKFLDDVYRDLFRSEGSEIYMKNATSYIKPGVAVDFYTVLEAAKRKNHIAIGYRIEKFKDDPEKAYGIVINPDKPAIVHFANEDKLIVISED
jgi:voltage-gated potassium channel Kch/K+/H+ antiporter YhaU regulatory subunit KhtT